MHNAVLVIVDLSVHLPVWSSVTADRGLCPMIVSSPYGNSMVLVFWRQISSAHCNSTTLKLKYKWKCGRQNSRVIWCTSVTVESEGWFLSCFVFFKS